MLDPQEWLHLAQQLEEGRKASFEHSCGSGKKLLVEHKQDGWAAWCYRCSEAGWQPKPRPSLAERLERIKHGQTLDAAASGTCALPQPIGFDVGEWPSHARVWLYQAGIDNDAIGRHGFYYCDRLDRCVLPVFDGRRELVYWQARGFDPERPKYINPPIDKPLAAYGERGSLVLCEDILSAARIGEVARGTAILGTSLDERGLAAVVRELRGRPAVLWFDPDDAGRKAARQVRLQLAGAGVSSRVVRSPRDPKFYSREEITRFLRFDPAAPAAPEGEA